MPESARETGGVEGLLEGKRGLVFGVANRRSIAWSIAQALSRSGARLAFTYQGERLKDKVEELVKETPPPAGLSPPSPLYSCDVTNDGEIAAACQAAGRDLGGLELVIHSVA